MKSPASPPSSPAPQAASKAVSPSLPLSRGRIVRPQKGVIYGPEGVGKSSLAAQLPHPLFLDTESGTHHLEVTRFDGVETWEDMVQAVDQLIRADHDFRTLVIDTADWAEKRLAEHLCQKANKASIEDFGYGKGYVLLAEEFQKFLNSLNVLPGRFYVNSATAVGAGN